MGVLGDKRKLSILREGCIIEYLPVEIDEPKRRNLSLMLSLTEVRWFLIPCVYNVGCKG